MAFLATGGCDRDTEKQHRLQWFNQGGTGYSRVLVRLDFAARSE
jgi:hypothetical protein